jgi:hypothetical protein
MVSDLIQRGEYLAGLFLESPFSNLGDEFKYHWLSVVSNKITITLLIFTDT